MQLVDHYPVKAYNESIGIFFPMLSKEKLLKLYILDKKSSAEIAETFRFSEHKVNYWIKKYKIPKRSISEAVYIKHNPDGDPFKVRVIKSLKDAKLLGLGLGLYWGEGNKKNKTSIRLGNTDPALIRKFIEFLIKVFDIRTSKLRFGLQIFSDLSEKEVLKFWLFQLKSFHVKREQFSKVIITPTRGVGNYREKSQFGVLTVCFNNSKLKKILDSMLPL